MLDYLIKNGRIVDGSGKKLYIASIGISNGKIITNVSEDSEAIEIIDANKKIVTPGFIDVHSHDDFNVITDKNVSHNILQGITSMIVGNCGFGVSPFVSGAEQMSALYEVKDITTKWNSYEEYFDILSKNKIAINVGALVGHHTIRRHSLDEMKKEVPNKNELEKMANLLIEGMESGCLGLSTGLVYEPGRYSVSNEIIELAKKIQKYGFRSKCKS